MWMYIATFIVISIVYMLSRIIPWLYQLRKIWIALLPFSPEKAHWLLGILPIFYGPCETGIIQTLEWTAKHPKFYSMLIPLRPSLFVHHPGIMKDILKTTEPKGVIPATGSGYRFFIPWIGDGLLNSSGKKWHRNRKLLTPGFHFDVLKPYVQIYNDSVSKSIKYFEEQSIESGTKSIEIYHAVSLCTLNIILKCAFSSMDDVQDEGTESAYSKNVPRITQLLVKRIFSPHLYLDFIYKLTNEGREFFKLCDHSHNVADAVINQRRQMLAKYGESIIKSKRYVDFLDILLLAKDENGNTLSDVEIRDEVDTFMFEGHDTTASGITWALYNLAQHKDIQKQVYHEVGSLMKGKGQLEWDDLNKLTYLTMCIKESLRCHPPVPAATREITKPMSIEGHKVPIGTLIDINFLNLHHNPTVWGEDHLSYRPERFDPNDTSQMGPFSFLPFSAGPRNCIGQVFAMNEMKVIIGRIIHNFEISVDETHPVERVPDLILRPKYGIKLRFVKRELEI